MGRSADRHLDNESSLRNRDVDRQDLVKRTIRRPGGSMRGERSAQGLQEMLNLLVVGENRKAAAGCRAQANRRCEGSSVRVIWPVRVNVHIAVVVDDLDTEGEQSSDATMLIPKAPTQMPADYSPQASRDGCPHNHDIGCRIDQWHCPGSEDSLGDPAGQTSDPFRLRKQRFDWPGPHTGSISNSGNGVQINWLLTNNRAKAAGQSGFAAARRPKDEDTTLRRRLSVEAIRRLYLWLRASAEDWRSTRTFAIDRKGQLP